MSTIDTASTGQNPAAVIVLAAGAGTRMKSRTPKVLHEIGGRSLLVHALTAAEGTGPGELVVVLRHERERVAAALAEAGWDLPSSQANFVWLPLGERTQAFAEAAQARALSVRAFADEGVRVSIGEQEANDRFLEVARDFLA